MIRLLTLEPAQYEKVVICTTNQRISHIGRIAGAACCGAIRGYQVREKRLFVSLTSYKILVEMKESRYNLVRLRNVKGSREAIAESEFTINDFAEHKGKWNEVFGNDNPIRIEIGMGKGKFITELALQNPDINYIGIEKYSSVLIRAIEKRKDIELNNLIYIRMDAVEICDAFEKGEVDRIYLNFSDPWPKDRHAKRRLTSRQFFARYDEILKPDGKVEFKTDNRGLFDFSLEEIPETAFKIDEYTFDLHSDKEADIYKGNVMTEYEEKFVGLGNPICKLVASRK